VAAVIVLGGAGVVRQNQSNSEAAQMQEFLKQLDVAERSYAAGPPARGFTCDGPNLTSVRGIEWRTDAGLGGIDRNQGLYGGYWIVLRCEPVARPSYYTVTASPASGFGARIVYDSRSGQGGMSRP
jgi:hypothetical protein